MKIADERLDVKDWRGDEVVVEVQRSLVDMKRGGRLRRQ